eukprot:IDg21644t1
MSGHLLCASSPTHTLDYQPLCLPSPHRRTLLSVSRYADCILTVVNLRLSATCCTLLHLRTIKNISHLLCASSLQYSRDCQLPALRLLTVNTRSGH